MDTLPRPETERNKHEPDNETSQEKPPGKINQRGKPIPGHAREVILKVAEVCEEEAKNNCCKYHLHSPTKRAAMYTGVSERTIQRIRNEEKLKQTANIETKKVCLDEESNYNTVKRIGKKGQTIPVSARNIIAKVIEACDKEHRQADFLVSLACKNKRTALYTGVSQRTVQRIRHEDIKRNKVNVNKILKTPGKTRKRTTFIDNIDEFDFQSIRKLIYDLILIKKVNLTCTALHSMIKERHNFPYSEETLYRLLRSKGFEWHKAIKGKKMLVEQPEIFKGRLRYLKELKSYEELGTFVIYLDDKWIGDNESSISTGSVFDSSKKYCSRRVVFFHEFSAFSFVKRAEKLFKSNDVIFKPDKVALENWLKQKLLPHIPPSSLIILSSTLTKQNIANIPTEHSKKSSLIKFLKKEHLNYDSTQTSSELYRIIKGYIDKVPLLCEGGDIDTIIESYGHKVLRLPTYLSEFNPIELVWADIKRYIRDNNPAGKIIAKDVHKITLQAVECFQDKIQNYIQHVVELEHYFLDRESLMEEHYNSIDIVSARTMSQEITNPNTIPNSLRYNTNLEPNTNIVTHNNLQINSLAELVSNLPNDQITYSKNLAIPVLNIGRIEDDVGQPGTSYLNL